LSFVGERREMLPGQTPFVGVAVQGARYMPLLHKPLL